MKTFILAVLTTLFFTQLTFAEFLSSKEIIDISYESSGLCLMTRNQLDCSDFSKSIKAGKDKEFVRFAPESFNSGEVCAYVREKKINGDYSIQCMIKGSNELFDTSHLFVGKVDFFSTSHT